MKKGLLSDLKVLELGELFSAPYCCKLLADLGADVIKIEPPQGGDVARTRGPFQKDVPHLEGSGLFLYLNTNKMGISLDVGSPSGREIFLRLLDWADVVIENLGPKKLSSLRLEFADLSEVKPDIVLTSISPFGQTGPHSEYKAPDLVSFHMGGYASVVGGPVEDVNAEAPLKAAEFQSDYAAAVNAAAATLAGLLAKANSGVAQHVDVSKQESTIPFVFSRIAKFSYDDVKPTREMNDNPPDGVVAVLPTSDGLVAISPREDHLWARWLEVMGNPAWASDERFKSRASRTANWAELEPLLIEWTSQRRKDDIFRAAQAARVPSFPVNTMEDIFESAQLAHRGFFKEIDHPHTGTLTYPTLPYKFSTAEWTLRRPAPLHGEHNDEVLCGLLDYSSSDVVRLRQANII